MRWVPVGLRPVPEVQSDTMHHRNGLQAGTPAWRRAHNPQGATAHALPTTPGPRATPASRITPGTLIALSLNATIQENCNGHASAVAGVVKDRLHMHVPDWLHWCRMRHLHAALLRLSVLVFPIPCTVFSDCDNHASAVSGTPVDGLHLHMPHRIRWIQLQQLRSGIHGLLRMHSHPPALRSPTATTTLHPASGNVIDGLHLCVLGRIHGADVQRLQLSLHRIPKLRSHPMHQRCGLQRPRLKRFRKLRHGMQLHVRQRVQWKPVQLVWGSTTKAIQPAPQHRARLMATATAMLLP